MACKTVKPIEFFQHPIEIGKDECLCNNCFDKRRKKRKITNNRIRKRKKEGIKTLANDTNYGNRYIVSGHFKKDDILHEFHFIVICHVHFSKKYLTDALKACELFDYEVCGLGVIERDKLEGRVFELILSKGIRGLQIGVYQIMLKLKKMLTA